MRVSKVTLFPDELYRHRFREEFIQKYSDRKPDVIITAGSASLNFIAELHEPFVRDTPIIFFCTVLEGIPDRTGPDMHFTGVLGTLHPEGDFLMRRCACYSWAPSMWRSSVVWVRLTSNGRRSLSRVSKKYEDRSLNLRILPI